MAIVNRNGDKALKKEYYQYIFSNAASQSHPENHLTQFQ